MKFSVLLTLAALIGAQAQAAVRQGRITDVQECSTYNDKCRSVAKPSNRACALATGNTTLKKGQGKTVKAVYSIPAIDRVNRSMTALVMVFNPEGTLQGPIHSGGGLSGGGESAGEWLGHVVGKKAPYKAVIDVYYIRVPIVGAGKYLEYKCKLK